MKRKDRLRAEPKVAPMTLEEVGVVLGVTRERVRQIEANALRKLRNRLRAKGYEIEDFLEEYSNDRKG